MAKANKQVVYETLIQNPEIFFDYLMFQEREEDYKNTNMISEYEYEEFLERVASKKVHSEGQFLRETLSIDNMIEKNIFNYGDKINGKKTLIIARHIIEMFKNIYEEFGKPLNNTDFEKFELLMANEVDYYRNSTLRKSIELEERMDSTIKVLNEATENIKSSLANLKYRTQHLSNINDLEDLTSDINKMKFKETKDLYDRNIKPLYHFTNEKYSGFLKQVYSLRDFLQKKESRYMYSLERRLGFYIKKYLFLVQEVKPIREYISNYIREGEKYLKRNIGNEVLFNKLEQIIDEKSTGKKIGETNIISMNVSEVKKINLFFKNNCIQNGKDKNIKEKELSVEYLRLIDLHLLENIKNLQKEAKVAKILNEQFEERKKLQDLKIKREKELNKLFNLFNKEMKNKKINELTSYIKEFFEENNFDYSIGEFQFFIMSFLQKSGGIKINNTNFNEIVVFNTTYIYGEEQTLIKNNKKLRYKEIKRK